MADTPVTAPNSPSSEPETRVRIDLKQVSTEEAQKAQSMDLEVIGSNSRMLSGDAIPKNHLDALFPELKLIIFNLLKHHPLHAYAFCQAFGFEGEWVKKGEEILSKWRKTFLDPELVRLDTASARLVTPAPRGDVATQHFHCYAFRSSVLWERSKKFKIEEWCPEEFAARYEQGVYFRSTANTGMNWRIKCDDWVLDLYLRHLSQHHGVTALNGTWRHTVRDCVLHCDLASWWKSQYESDFVAISLEEGVTALRSIQPTWDGKHSDRILMTVGALAFYQKYAAICRLAGPDTELEPYDVPIDVHRDFFERGEECTKTLKIHQDTQHPELWKNLATTQVPNRILTYLRAIRDESNGETVWELYRRN